MIEIEKPKIETVEINDDAKYGKFVVEPLERGYGTTLGNSLRRILLSSLPGAAVTAIQIDGVLHEFSTIEGVVEDVTSIILNVKKLALKIYSDEEKTLEIDVQGEGVITAADITHDSDVEILNPDLYIATIGKNGHMRMRLSASVAAAILLLFKIREKINQLVLFQLMQSILLYLVFLIKLKIHVLVN